MAPQGADSRSIQAAVDAARPGALAGARLGIGAIPETLRSRLEDGHKGRRHLESLADRLFERGHSRADGESCPEAYKVRKHAGRSGRRVVRGNLDGRVGVSDGYYTLVILGP